MLISFLDLMKQFNSVLRRNIWKPDHRSAAATDLCGEPGDHSSGDKMSSPDNPPNLACRVAHGVSQCSVQFWLSSPAERLSLI